MSLRLMNSTTVSFWSSLVVFWIIPSELFENTKRSFCIYAVFMQFASVFAAWLFIIFSRWGFLLRVGVRRNGWFGCIMKGEVGNGVLFDKCCRRVYVFAFLRLVNSMKRVRFVFLLSAVSNEKSTFRRITNSAAWSCSRKISYASGFGNPFERIRGWACSFVVFGIPCSVFLCKRIRKHVGSKKEPGHSPQWRNVPRLKLTFMKQYKTFVGLLGCRDAQLVAQRFFRNTVFHHGVYILSAAGIAHTTHRSIQVHHDVRTFFQLPHVVGVHEVSIGVA